MIETKVYDSLVCILPENGSSEKETRHFTFFRNEPISFQMAYRLKDLTEEEAKREIQHFLVRIQSEIPIQTYHVACVPVAHSFQRICPKQPIGMFPDVLIKKKTNPTLVRQTIKNAPGFRYVESGERISTVAYEDSWRQLWFTVNEDGEELPAGNYTVQIDLLSQTLQKLGSETIRLDVLDALLPEQKLIYTNWFHNDCLADFYDIEVFSEEYFSVMAEFLKPAVKHGMNMILLPAFTPPLDTPIGGERMTVQLVKIKKDGDRYSFDFSLMKRYIEVCRSVGIYRFEHSHLFTQWGAAHAPKIIAEVNGEDRQIFGWETEASGEEYVSFLSSYLPSLRAFLRSESIEDTTLFHISDEPDDKNFESYEKSYQSVKHLLEGLLVGDALSDPKYYESGLVQTPIARTHRAREFFGKCDDLWIYYTGAECYGGLSNRLIQLPRERNRSLGYQLYVARAKGFLHWAYNFYYGSLSYGLYNPMLDPCCGFPNAGTTYSVYPDVNRKPLPSIHQKVFYEAILDVRVLEMLEKLAGREATEDLIEKHFGKTDFYNTARSREAFLAFRNEVNEKIKKYIA